MKIIQSPRDKASAAMRESKKIEFKQQFDPKSDRDWCEIIKDVVSMSNSGGGMILLGVSNNGTLSGFDCSGVMAVDPAKITDKIAKYTDVQFTGVEIVEVNRSGTKVAAFEVRGSRIPMVFVKEGRYLDGTTQKIAFARGTLYFRHGAKSEPADSHDLGSVIDKERDSARSSILSRIKAVVSLPIEKQVQIASIEPAELGAIPVVLVDKPVGGKVVGMLDPNRSHPFRQKDVIEQVNRRLDARARVNQYDIQCIRRVYRIDDQRRYCYRPLHSSAHFSPGFIDWIVKEFEKNESFFKETRLKNLA